MKIEIPKVKFVKISKAVRDDSDHQVRGAEWEARLLNEPIGQWLIGEDGTTYAEAFGMTSDLFDTPKRWKALVQREVARRERSRFELNRGVDESWESRRSWSGPGVEEWHVIEVDGIRKAHLIGTVPGGLAAQDAFEVRVEFSYRHHRLCPAYTVYGPREF